MEFVAGWQGLAVAAATAGMLLSALVFSLGAIFDLRALRVWARAEFFQSVVSALLVGVLLTLSLGISALAVDLAGGQEPIAFADDYLEEVNGRIESVSGATTLFVMVVDALKEIEVGVEVAPVHVSGKPLAGLDPILHDAEMILGLLSWVKLFNEVQRVLFLFISATMMYYFLPVGVILRGFSLTRPVGAFMMALAVGAYFVLPLTYVFNAAAVEKTNASIDARLESLKEFNSQVSLSSLDLLNPAAVSAFVASLISSGVWNMALAAIAPLAKLVADLTVETTFFPFFNLLVVFLFTRSLYRVLASEVVLWT
ncbi:hypothetical protein HYV43_00145 [Candidatus Micrarchaeota archaeon]|nr:hypothetical protein [Candidatus Micrarchaeota archaeon]